jgi:uncharacterized protein YprB with RNaseH-like and TPR domain
MNLKRKLANLQNAGPGSQPLPRDEPPAAAANETTTGEKAANDDVRAAAPAVAHAAPSIESDRAARIRDLRGRIHAMMTRPSTPRAPQIPIEARLDALPFARSDREEGPVYARIRSYPATQRHGNVPLYAALDARGDAIATLSLDERLGAFDPSRALYLDTETTGLSGGTGTLAFLIGLAWFEGRTFHVEQLFLTEPAHERAMLTHLAERIARSSALVSYNGKAFDMPLERSRFVMARVKAPKEPPHLDLVHASRRIYGERLEQCKLTTLERDVLGFVREGDVPSGEIPARYAQFLRTGEASQLLAVIEHNLWDVIAMAALVGELGARAAGGDASGRFEPSDMTGLAKTALRAGANTLATTLAEDAAKIGRRKGHHEVVVRANTLAAKLHRRQGNHLAMHERLLDALASAPDDTELHLALAKLYEHRLKDPVRALEHAQRARGEEDPAAHAKRVARLAQRIKKLTLPLRGIET